MIVPSPPLGNISCRVESPFKQLQSRLSGQVPLSVITLSLVPLSVVPLAQTNQQYVFADPYLEWLTGRPVLEARKTYHAQCTAS